MDESSLKQENFSLRQKVEILTRDCEFLQEEVEAAAGFNLDGCEKKLETFTSQMRETRALLYEIEADDEDDENDFLDLLLKELDVTFLDHQKSDYKEEDDTHWQQEYEKTREKLLDATVEINERMHKEAELEEEKKELQEELTVLDMQFKSQCAMNERLREELEEMRERASLEKPVEVDTQRKGNSLFAEVEDRRIEAEKRVVKLDFKYKQIEDDLSMERLENKKLKRKINLLRQHSSKQGYNESIVVDLQRQLWESKKELLNLAKKHEQEIKSLGSGFEHCGTGESRFQMQTSEIQNLRQEREAQRVQLAARELNLTTEMNKAVSLQYENEKLNRQVINLKADLQDLQQKYEPEEWSDVKEENLPDVPKDKKRTMPPTNADDTSADNNSSEKIEEWSDIKEENLPDVPKGKKRTTPPTDTGDTSADNNSSEKIEFTPISKEASHSTEIEPKPAILLPRNNKPKKRKTTAVETIEYNQTGNPNDCNNQ